jgi:hypothetical protein
MIPAMKPREGSTLHVWLVAAAMLLAPLSIYTFAYFACTKGMGKRFDNGGPTRVYRTSYEALIFFPGTLVESALTGQQVLPAWTAP